MMLGLLAPNAIASAGDVVISQVYVNGGAASATWRNDYVELHNRSSSPVSLSGWSIQYASNTGSSWTRTNLSATTLAAGQFYLIQLSAGAGGGLQPLPTPDATGTTNIGNGKLALMRISTTIASGTSCPVSDANVAVDLEDFVGLGSSNCFEGAAVAPANPSGSTATYRREVALGCTDTDQNGADFTTGTADPRNTASTPAWCDDGACCFGVNCTVTSQAGCSGGVFHGAGSSCSPDPCSLGACCLDTGACLLLDINDCGLQGGVVFLGEGTTCTGGACTPGACCYEGGCYFYPREWCSTNPPGRYNGDGVVCAGLDPSCSLGACCRADGQCTYELEQDCVSAGVFMGLNATCAPALCAPAGACCFGTFGTLCEVRFASNCVLSSGSVYRGDGTTCTPGQCPNTTGACCLPDETCVQASIGECGFLNGTHQGVGLACTINLCVSDPVGACCRTAICEILTQSLCASVSGTFVPNQTTCASNPCGAPLGACCFGINCSIVSASVCGGNLFLGAGSSCLPDPCGTGACCTLAGACSITDVAMCEGAGSIYLGNGVTCSPGMCADIGACCFDSQCYLLPAVPCQNLNGDPRGAGTGCTPSNDCLTVVFRACCQTDECMLWDADTCDALGGTFLPNETTCDANPCGAPLGACCFTLTNLCEIRSAAACSGPGGGPKVFHGAGTSCVSSPCGDPGLGACCIASACTTRIASTCTSAGGLFLGAGVACDANTCLVVGACCLLDGACAEFTSTACATASGVYSGDGTTCTANLCPRGCCLPDQSCVFVTSTACTGLGGTSRPGACSPTFCFVTCCAPDGTCTLVSDAACIASGGVREGQSACGLFNCFGACCFASSGVCQVRGKLNCVNTLVGTYLGYQTPCQPTTCTGACCMPGTMTCTLEFRGDCLAMGGLFVGFEVACGPTACLGVCCVSTGCTNVTQSQCDALGGTYRFHGYNCIGACEGACCDSAGGCSLTLPSGCGAGSVFRGLGTVCDAAACSGACCTAAGCALETVATCTGSFQGVGAACAPGSCGGACCVRDAAPFCRVVSQSACTPASGGIYLGDGTTCTATNVCFGACCFDPAVEGVPLVCQFTSLGFCYGQSGEFHGLNTTCQSPPGSGNWVECCVVNMNMVGGLTVQDLFDFLALYFAMDTRADINDSGTFTVQDIFDFLAGYFFGCS
ncbi:MAG: lamin tail domain-containing protein [Phycisphaerales bacterium]|nr:lamin tail domain-containing protein [Phycisphaerales bacterium]